MEHRRTLNATPSLTDTIDSLSRTERNLNIVMKDSIQRFLPHPGMAKFGGGNPSRGSPAAAASYSHPTERVASRPPMFQTGFSAEVPKKQPARKLKPIPHSPHRQLLHEVTGHTQDPDASARGKASPHPTGRSSPAPTARSMIGAEADGVYAAGRIAEAALRQRRRLMSGIGVDATEHSPARFVQDITQFVQTQLAELEKRFPHDPSIVHHIPKTTLLPEEIAAKRTGSSTATVEEQRRRLRLQVFQSAHHLFADAFPSYRMFLDAIADEHESYAQFLLDDLTLHKEVILGLRDQITSIRNVDAGEVQALEREVQTLQRKLDGAHAVAQKNRRAMEHNDAMRERQVKESDARRTIAHLEQSNVELTEELQRVRAELATSQRQNQNLTLTTFSDHLEAANAQVAEWKVQFHAKEEQLNDTQDKITHISVDLRKLMQHYNKRCDVALAPDDVALSAEGLKICFPAEARRRRHEQIMQDAAETGHLDTRLLEEMAAEATAESPRKEGEE